VTESALVRLRADVAYTVQIGGADRGAGPASGPATVRIRFLGDRDGDGRIDRLDECPSLAGVRSAGFCPPQVAVSPLYAFQAAPGGGIQLVRFDVRARDPRRARVELTCGRGCSFQRSGTARASRVARLVREPGVRVPAGARLELRATARGHIGLYRRYTVRGGRIVGFVERCLLPGSSKPRVSCT
jgi:hypothetical protein